MLIRYFAREVLKYQEQLKDLTVERKTSLQIKCINFQ